MPAAGEHALDLLESWTESPFPSPMDRPDEQKAARPDVSHGVHDMSSSRPRIIGLYGLPGSGKTRMLEWIMTSFHDPSLLCFEGSDLIAGTVTENCQTFMTLSPEAKESSRKAAMTAFKSHFMFWTEDEDTGRTVYTKADLEAYTSIVYLDASKDDIERRRAQDVQRQRDVAHSWHLQRWKDEEKARLRELCREHGILFSTMTAEPDDYGHIADILHYHLCTVEMNESLVLAEVDKVVTSKQEPQIVVVLDADKTLAAVDTGALYWELLRGRIDGTADVDGDPVSRLFKHSAWKYSYAAFKQATLLYEESAATSAFERLCDLTAAQVDLFPELLSLLQCGPDRPNLKALVITSGLRRVWEKVLVRHGLRSNVSVVGGGRMSDGYVITPLSKRNAVQHLQLRHQMRVWAVGDSPLDLPMLQAADRAIVVVTAEEVRSRTMESALQTAIDHEGLVALQLLLPAHVRPRLSTDRLPLVDDIYRTIMSDTHLQFHHFTETAGAKLLMTPMRDAQISGVTLREAHRRVGWFLAIQCLSAVLNLDRKPIIHVQGQNTDGYCFENEARTTIVAMMRGGEPMAFGVNDAMPTSHFVHAFEARDVTKLHLDKQRTVVLVDAVVNSGASLVEFVRHIRGGHPRIRIIVVAGVVHQGSLYRGEAIHGLSKEGHLTIIALRTSDNSFKGSRTTDTGNRLFMTTHLK
ncbi:hypothetical protein LTR78_010319 [Recurvomyces mirabilis]|uniref:Phosphoribosyltransferase domain-containing protein n=1 Tax=Recurvomyces mirabilis TaxID=574656 RepID=A0AAE0WGY2_9PEZI|nr:hypothetical protein LTR78_010319 [Recurvomyces mirabilis]KAK5149867.1 hypothetical protein LTS14_010582 [Recurvomyces mirabilis]